MIEGLSASPREFYAQVVAALERRDVPGLATSYVYASEAGILSGKRLYLAVRRKELVFHVCGAPFARGFFVSWWLGEDRGPLSSLLVMVPLAATFFPWLFRPRTYYEVDTALMYQSLTHTAVLEVVDALTEAKALRGPAELERKPILTALAPSCARLGRWARASRSWRGL